jgi:hypothetical protein
LGDAADAWTKHSDPSRTQSGSPERNARLSERLARSTDDRAQFVVHVVTRLADGVVVILDDDRAAGSVARDGVDDTLRIGA